MAIQKKSLIGNLAAAKKAIVASNVVSSPVLAKSATQANTAKLAKAQTQFAKLAKHV